MAILIFYGHFGLLSYSWSQVVFIHSDSIISLVICRAKLATRARVMNFQNGGTMFWLLRAGLDIGSLELKI
jgi:hypothetical protein